MERIVRFVVAMATVVTLAAAASNFKTPEYLESCPRNDNACLKKLLQVLVPKLSKGSNEFSLQPLDPMHIPEMQVVYQMGDNIKGNVTVINSDTYALSKIRINDVRSNVNDTHLYMEVDVKFPGVFVEGSYKANGLIVVFPINGKGVFNISMTDVSTTWKLSGQVIKRNEVEYLRLDHFNMRPVVGDMKFYASELFTGSDELNAAALTFANQFWPIVYEALLPFVDEGWDQVMTDAANKIFLKVPFKELFPNGPL